MGQYAGLLATAVLVFLSAVHVYWAFGGQRGLDVAIPSLEGRPMFQPGAAATLGVAGLLLLAAWLVLGGLLSIGYPWPWIYAWGTWGVAVVFLLRAVGDFQVAGFFKRVRGTRFANWDDKLFSPLCLTIAALVTLSVLLRCR